MRKEGNMRACSFLPAVTQMIYDMQLQHKLHGVTFECPSVASDEKPKVVRSILEGRNFSSTEVDRIFSAGKAQSKSLYFVDHDLLESIAPDIIFTQDVCDVCQVDTACAAAAVEKLSKKPQIIAITPTGLDDVFASAVTIASALGEEEKAYVHLASLDERMDHIIDRLRVAKAKPKRVMLIEWMAPIYNCGHWIPDQIAMAGGIDMLSNPRGHSMVTPWEKIVRYDPEVLVIAPCGFSVARAMDEIHLLSRRTGWNTLQAVQNRKVFVADFDLFSQPSASSLVSGIEVLSSIFHPGLFGIKEHLKHKVYALEKVY